MIPIEMEVRDFEVRFLVDAYAVKEIVDEWNQLAEQSGWPTGRFEYFSAAYQAFHSNDELKILTIRSQGRLLLLLPLIRVSRFLLPWHVNVGGESLFEPAPLLMDRNFHSASLGDLQLASNIPITLDRIVGGDRLLECRILRSYLYSSNRSYSADTSLGWESYLSRRSSRRRADLRRAERKAGGHENIHYVEYLPWDNEYETAFHRAVAVEDRNWKGRNKSSLVNLPKHRNFLWSLGEKSSANFCLKVVTLFVGEEAAAVQWVIDDGEAYWVLKIGYDEKFADASPGLLLCIRTIQYCCQTNRKRYCFLGAAEPWIKPWSDTEYIDNSFHLFPSGFGGSLISTFLLGREWIKRFLNALSNSSKQA